MTLILPAYGPCAITTNWTSHDSTRSFP